MMSLKRLIRRSSADMRILIDADGCPVVDNTIKIAKRNDIECIILCDTSHIFEKQGITTVTVSKGADSVDYALVNMLKAGDVAVTQDYGLAAMCLAKNGFAISQNGLVYDDSNIDSLLLARHTAKKIRNVGGRIKGPSKRTAKQDILFEEALQKLIDKRF